MKFEDSIESGVHAHLSLLVGEWTGAAKTWFEPGVVGDESPMTGRMKAILGGRFILHEYTGSMAGKPFEGVAIYGFDLATNKFQSAWIDSFHMSTGIMFSEGDLGTSRANALRFWAVTTPAGRICRGGAGGPRST